MYSADSSIYFGHFFRISTTIWKHKHFESALNDISQRACHGQTTSKQLCINVCNVYTTLFQRRLTMMCPLGYETIMKDLIVYYLI